MATAARAPGRTVRAAVAAAIRAARDADRLKAWHEPDASVALKIAKALDARDLSTMDLTRLSGELRSLLSRLPLAEETPERGGSGDGPAASAGSPGEGQPHAVGLASVVGAGPEVGYTALPA